jgi:hypothetical protein
VGSEKKVSISSSFVAEGNFYSTGSFVFIVVEMWGESFAPSTHLASILCCYHRKEINVRALENENENLSLLVVSSENIFLCS